MKEKLEWEETKVAILGMILTFVVVLAISLGLWLGTQNAIPPCEIEPQLRERYYINSAWDSSLQKFASDVEAATDLEYVDDKTGLTYPTTIESITINYKYEKPYFVGKDANGNQITLYPQLPDYEYGNITVEWNKYFVWYYTYHTVTIK